MITVEHDLAFRTSRQFEAIKEWVSRIVGVSFACITIPSIFVAIARIVLVTGGAWTTPQFDPGHVYVPRFVALQISRIKIKTHKTPPTLISGSRGPQPKTGAMKCGRQGSDLSRCRRNPKVRAR
jgi:hypothetical protein